MMPGMLLTVEYGLLKSFYSMTALLKNIANHISSFIKMIFRPLLFKFCNAITLKSSFLSREEATALRFGPYITR